MALMESQSFYMSLADGYPTSKGRRRASTAVPNPEHIQNIENDEISKKSSLKNKFEFSPKSLTSLKYGWMLILINLLGFTCFVAMESAVPMESQFIEAFNSTGKILTHSQFMDFTTYFSLPNIPGSFLGGYLVEAIGYRRATCIFLFLAACGQLLLSYGCFITNMTVVLLGRCIFGVCSEIISITGYIYVLRWFSGDWFNFIFAVRVSTARMGASLVTMYGERVYKLFMESESLNFFGLNQKIGELKSNQALCLFFVVTTASVLCGFICSLLMLFHLPDNQNEEEDDEEELEQPKIQRSRNSSRNGSFLESNSQEEPLLSHDSSKESTLLDTCKEWVKLMKLNVPGWLVIIGSVLFYINIEAWLNQAKLMYEQLHGVDGDTSSLLCTILSFVPIFACPVFGYLIDKLKGNAWWAVVGCLLSAIGHAFIAIEAIPTSVVYVATILLGLGYSMIGSCVWTLFSLSVPPHMKTIGYGVMQGMQHLGMIIGAKTCGAIVDSFKNKDNIIQGYRVSEIFFIIITLAASMVILVYAIGYEIGPNGAVRKDQDDYQALIDDLEQQDDKEA